MTEHELKEMLARCRTPEMPDHARQRLLALAEEDQSRPDDRGVLFSFTRATPWLAAAAVLAVAGGIALLSLQHGVSSQPTDAEAREAARQLRLIFASTSSAVRRAKATAISDTLSDAVAPAVRRTTLSIEPQESDSPESQQDQQP